MKRNLFFKLGFIFFFFLMGTACSEKLHFVDSETGFSIDIPYGFKPFNQEQRRLQNENQKEQSVFHFVSKWGVLSIVLYKHEQFEADDEALALFLKSRLYGQSKEGETRYLDYCCCLHEGWIALQAILVGGSKMAPLYTQTLILDNRQTEIQVRLTVSDLKQLQTPAIKQMLDSAQFAQQKAKPQLKTRKSDSSK